MSLSDRYEEFGAPGTFKPGSGVPVPDEGLEDIKLNSFESGYQAGWEDAVKAQSSEQNDAITSIAQRLEDISFTHAEAIVKMNTAMQPLLSKITLSLLPDIAKESLGAHVIEQLSDLLKNHASEAIQIAVAPDNLEPLQNMLEGRVTSPFALTSEPALGAGQVYLRTNTAEREINLDAVQEGIKSALDAFFAQTQEELRHG